MFLNTSILFNGDETFSRNLGGGVAFCVILRRPDSFSFLFYSFSMTAPDSRNKIRCEERAGANPAPILLRIVLYIISGGAEDKGNIKRPRASRGLAKRERKKKAGLFSWLG